MIWFIVLTVNFVKPRSRSHVHLAAYYRLYSLGYSFIIKIHGCAHTAVVCNSDSGLSHFLCTGDKLSDTARSVKQTVFAVKMKMNEAHSYLLYSII